MNVCIVGDSNFRELFTHHKEDFAKSLKNQINFEYATSVASVKRVLESPEFKPDILFIASPTNEISQKK